MLVRILFYGITAHLLIGWAFFFFVPSRDRESKPAQVPVQIRLAEKPVRVEKTPLKPSEAASGGSPRPSRTPTPRAPIPPSSQPPPRYSDLLPKAMDGQITAVETPATGDAPLLPGQSFKPGRSGVAKQKLMVDASILSGALDVPLHARRISSGSEAFLRIVRSGRGQLRIVDLRGDPMLRAVIFENLLEPRVRAMILELMDALQENSLPLTLRTLTAASTRWQNETDFTWIGRRLIIRKAAPPVSRASLGAITLPDEEAKKAVIRDRLQFERFQQSRAYRSALQNHELPAQP